jgi:hypothetical protein
LSKLFRRDFEVVAAGLQADFAHEAIAFADDRLQKLRLYRIIVKRHANFADRGIDALLDVDENIFAPQNVGNLFACDQLALVVDEQHEQLQRKAFHPEGVAVAGELKTAEIQLEFGESHSFAGHVRSVFCLLTILVGGPLCCQDIGGFFR